MFCFNELMFVDKLIDPRPSTLSGSHLSNLFSSENFHKPQSLNSAIFLPGRLKDMEDNPESISDSVEDKLDANGEPDTVNGHAGDSVPSPAERVALSSSPSSPNASKQPNETETAYVDPGTIDVDASVSPEGPTDRSPSSSFHALTDDALEDALEANDDEENDELDSETRRIASLAKGKGRASSEEPEEPDVELDTSTDFTTIDRTPHSLILHSRKLSSGSLVRQISGELMLPSSASATAEPRSEPTTPGKTPKPRRKANESVNSPVWAAHKKHFFVLSTAGKPIYTRWVEVDTRVYPAALTNFSRL